MLQQAEVELGRLLGLQDDLECKMHDSRSQEEADYHAAELEKIHAEVTLMKRTIKSLRNREPE